MPVCRSGRGVYFYIINQANMNQYPQYPDSEQRHRFRHRHHRDRQFPRAGFGLVILLVGALLLLHKLNFFPYLSIHDTWPVILIIIGLAIGVRRRFTNNAWWILILIGVLKLIPEFEIMGQSSAALAIPAALIVGGLILILRPGKKKDIRSYSMETVTNTEHTLNVDVTFGGRKEIVTSKDFRGGSVTATFAGVEINLMQADSIIQPMVMDMKVICGGIDLVVPSHWEVQNEIEPTFGSVEDHRVLRTPSETENKKVLILRGSCSFGSVEIKSY